VPMAKVRWDAKSSHEFVENYKIIQRVFEKKGIDKYLGAKPPPAPPHLPPRCAQANPLPRAADVEKLIRAKYQDNLENMQVSGGAGVVRAAGAATGPVCDVPPFHTAGAVVQVVLREELRRPAVRPAGAAGQGPRCRRHARVHHRCHRWWWWWWWWWWWRIGGGLWGRRHGIGSLCGASGDRAGRPERRPGSRRRRAHFHRRCGDGGDSTLDRCAWRWRRCGWCACTCGCGCGCGG